jgi:anthranilate phosphoribosyltransferase
MAPRHHSAMRHVGPTRVELGTRTVFNLLGPMANPAGVDRQLVGVFAPAWLEPMARVLDRLGTVRAWVVHGAGGLDEISLAGPTEVAALENGTIRRFTISPADAGLAVQAADSVKGGDAVANAAALRGVLAGAPGAYRDIVLLNAAAGLIVAGRAETLAEGVELAAAAIDGGAALSALDRLAALTRQPAPGETVPAGGA